MQKERQLEPKGHQTSLPSPTAHALIPVESEGLRVEAMPGISSVESERKAPPPVYIKSKNVRPEKKF